MSACSMPLQLSASTRETDYKGNWDSWLLIIASSVVRYPGPRPCCGL